MASRSIQVCPLFHHPPLAGNHHSAREILPGPAIFQDSRIVTGKPGSAKIAAECEQYTWTHWHPAVAPGGAKHWYRNEHLEQQTFPDTGLDLVMAHDVFEHMIDPARGSAELARALKPEGAHVFTVPWYYWATTAAQPARRPGGAVQQQRGARYRRSVRRSIRQPQVNWPSNTRAE